MNLHRWRPHTGGFTFVELLVVSAIVAILASLLLPALTVAKEKSQAIYCGNSLRQMGLSYHMYTEDNAGYFPWTFTLLGDQQKRETWFTYLQAGQNQKLWLCPVRPKTIPFAPIRPAGFFQRSQDGEIVYPSDGTVVNYAANIELGGFHNEGTARISPLLASAVSKPEETVLLCDSGSQVDRQNNPRLTVTPQSAPKHGAWILADPSSERIKDSIKATTDDVNWCGPRLRHLDKANVFFHDGRVELRSSSWYYAGTPYLRAARP